MADMLVNVPLGLSLKEPVPAHIDNLLCNLGMQERWALPQPVLTMQQGLYIVFSALESD